MIVPSSGHTNVQCNLGTQVVKNDQSTAPKHTPRCKTGLQSDSTNFSSVRGTFLISVSLIIIELFVSLIPSWATMLVHFPAQHWFSFQPRFPVVFKHPWRCSNNPRPVRRDSSGLHFFCTWFRCQSYDGNSWLPENEDRLTLKLSSSHFLI